MIGVRYGFNSRLTGRPKGPLERIRDLCVASLTTGAELSFSVNEDILCIEITRLISNNKRKSFSLTE